MRRMYAQHLVQAFQTLLYYILLMMACISRFTNEETETWRGGVSCTMSRCWEARGLRGHRKHLSAEPGPVTMARCGQGRPDRSSGRRRGGGPWGPAILLWASQGWAPKAAWEVINVIPQALNSGGRTL